jgi:hypothetical protein
MLEEREETRKRKMLHREKVEQDLKGNYTLIYPLVSYFEEFEILEKIKVKEEAEQKQKGYTAEEEENQQITSEYGLAWQK